MENMRAIFLCNSGHLSGSYVLLQYRFFFKYHSLIIVISTYSERW